MSESNETQEMDPIVDSNLKIMEEQMPRLLDRESMGGWAGKVELNGKPYPCVGGNFYADKRTGDINVFANNAPADITNNPENISAAFRVAYNSSKYDQENLAKGYAPIISLHATKKMSGEATKRLIEAGRLYNQKYAPSFEVNISVIEDQK